MKDIDLSRLWVVNVDQRRSRRQADRVDPALTLTRTLPGLLLPFERTAGDEIQGLLASGTPIVALIEGLARLDAADGLDEPGWRIGLGLGSVEDLTVSTTRAARGSAYLIAREAVEQASGAPAYLVAGAADQADRDLVRRAESALILWRTLLGRRSTKGWEVVDAVTAGESRVAIARRLGVSESAISQRLARAAWPEGVRGAELAEALLIDAESGRALIKPS